MAEPNRNYLSLFYARIWMWRELLLLHMCELTARCQSIIDTNAQRLGKACPRTVAADSQEADLLASSCRKSASLRRRLQLLRDCWDRFQVEALGAISQKPIELDL